MPDPEFFCSELSRIAEYVAICYPRPMQDDLVSGDQTAAGVVGHKWWLEFNSTPPAHVGYMPRQQLLKKMPNFERRNYMEQQLLTTFYAGGWEQCVVAKTPLRCAPTPPTWTPLFLHRPPNASSNPWEGWATTQQVSASDLASLRSKGWSLGQLKSMPSVTQNRHGAGGGGGGFWRLSSLVPILDYGMWLAGSLFLGLAYYGTVVVLGNDIVVFRAVAVGLFAGLAIGDIDVFSRIGYF